MMMLLMMSGRTPRPETTSPLSLTLPLLRTRRPAQAYVNGLNAASEQMEAAQAKGAPFSEIVMNPLDHPSWIFPPRGGAPDFSLTLFLRSFSNPSTRTHARAVQETWSPWRG